MDQQHPRPSSHLFTVRLWIEVLGDGQSEVRFKVQHVLSSETHYFREGSALLSYLTAKLQQLDEGNDEGGDM
jgi:hypothetical protein